jgi:hypothetical protein
MESIGELLDLQAGVISRRQVRARGLGDVEIARKLRRREWATVFVGVYVNHTGELTWIQRAWAAVLFSWPAALTHQSALRAAEGPGRHDAETGSIHVLVARARHLVEPPGVRVHRGAGFTDRIQWNRSPPRVRYEDAVLDLAVAATDDFASIALLSRAVQSRRTTARRLLIALAARERINRRDWVSAVLHDVADGACSVLEQGYLRRVERPHGLPRAVRQDVAAGRTGRIYRDASYREQLEVELDGRLFHDTAEGRDRDFDRDLVTLVGGHTTTRLSWGQVFGRPCWTAGQIGRLLIERGWAGTPRPCGMNCPLGG